MLTPLLFLLFCASSVTADYSIYQGFDSATCQGAPVGSYFTSDSEAGSVTLSRTVCTNNTHYTWYGYSDKTCTIISSQEVGEVGVCKPNTWFVGKASQITCVTGSFTKPTTGFVSSNLKDTSSQCSDAASYTVQYAVGVCLPFNGLTSLQFTCDKDAVRMRTYADSSCSNNTEVTKLEYGCSITDSRYKQKIDCYPPSSISASTSAAVVGGAVGGTIAVLALLGVLAFFYFRQRRRASAKMAIFELNPLNVIGTTTLPNQAQP